MAKRARGTRRSGQRRPTQRPAGRPAAPSTTSARGGVPAAPSPLGDGSGLASATATDARDGLGTTRAATARTRSGAASSSFVASVDREYAYVVSDVRRIVLLGGSLFAILIALFVLIEVVRVVKI